MVSYLVPRSRRPSTSGVRNVTDEIIRYFKTFCNVFLRFSSTDVFSRFPTADIHHRTFQRIFKKIAKKSTSFRVFSLLTSFRVLRLPTSFRVPRAELQPNFILVLTLFGDFHLPTTFRDFCLPTTFIGPSHIFLQKMAKIRRLSEIFRYFRLPMTFNGPPDVSFKKLWKNSFLFVIFWLFRLPTFLRFPPYDNFNGTSRRLFKKSMKKVSILVHMAFFEQILKKYLKMSAYRRLTDDVPIFPPTDEL